MNTTFRHISLFLLTALLAGCAERDLITPGMGTDGHIPIQLSAAYPTATRASDAGFEDGDRMGVYVMDYNGSSQESMTTDGIHASNVLFQFDGTDNTWAGSTPIYWTTNLTPADIVGYYPFISSVEDPTAIPFSISRRQDETGTDARLGGYEASDFLWAKAVKAMPTADRVDLTFRHLMAGVRVTLAKGTGFTDSEWTGASKAAVVCNILPNAVVNLDSGEVKVMENGSQISVTPYSVSDDWRAVVVPQTVKAGTDVIAVTVDGVSYRLAKDADFTYQSGKLHNFTITVNKKDGSGNYEFKLTDEAITAWIDDVEFRDGIMRSYTIMDVSTRGTLKDLFIKEGLDYKSISNLKLTGEINEIDFYFMRDEMSSLKSLHLGDVVVYCPKAMFFNYESEDEIQDAIPSSAMFHKSTLSRIIFPKNLKMIGGAAFDSTGLMGDLIIPEGVEYIGGMSGYWWTGAFANCHNLLGKLELPSTLKTVGYYAFYNDNFEGELILPESLEYIGECAFYGNNFSGQLVLPERLEYIGDSSFYGNNFSGGLEIPKGLSVINQYAFCNAGFSGCLVIPEGVQDIQECAFDNCGFRGELLLPSTLLTLGKYSFRENDISNIIFHENVTSIGIGCFMNCMHLNERIIIPQKVTRINDYTFAGCQLLPEVELHENVSFVGGAAFADDYNLIEITIHNPIPPLIGVAYEYDYNLEDNVQKDPLYGIPVGNITLKVPEGSREDYSRAELWRNIGRQATLNGFGCRPESISALNSSHGESIIIDSKGDWEISYIPSWCKTSSNSGSGKTQLTITFSELDQGSGNREDYVEFKMKGTDDIVRCAVSQFDCQYSENECLALQQASKGSGIDILFLGDAFDAKSIAGGEYLALVNEQMEAFFGVEPYATYRDYFNVYACITMSQETGINTTSTKKNTKFMTRYDNGTGCTVKGLACDNPDDVIEYALSHSPLKKDKLYKSLVIIALNSDQYGSATTLLRSQLNSTNGAAIAIVGRSSDPYPMDTRGMMQHEACGHAFGKLADERIVKNSYPADGAKYEIQEAQWRGWYQNISLSGKLNEVNWADLIFDPRYSDKVDVFEGAYGVTRGVYRAEINSCMNYGIPYFSAAARLDIMRRILEYSGEGFTMEKFYATDSDKWGPTGSGGSTRAAMPDRSGNYVNSGIHHPVRIIKSKKY